MQFRYGFSTLVPARVDFYPARACYPEWRQIEIFTVWNGLNKISGSETGSDPWDFGRCEKAFILILHTKQSFKHPQHQSVSNSFLKILLCVFLSLDQVQEHLCDISIKHPNSVPIQSQIPTAWMGNLKIIKSKRSLRKETFWRTSYQGTRNTFSGLLCEDLLF